MASLMQKHESTTSKYKKSISNKLPIKATKTILEIWPASKVQSSRT